MHVQISGFRPRQRIRDVRPVHFENVPKVDWGHRLAGKLHQSRVKRGEKRRLRVKFLLKGWPQATRGGRRPPWREQRDPGGVAVICTTHLLNASVKITKPRSFNAKKMRPKMVVSKICKNRINLKTPIYI